MQKLLKTFGFAEHRSLERGGGSREPRPRTGCPEPGERVMGAREKKSWIAGALAGGVLALVALTFGALPSCGGPATAPDTLAAQKREVLANIGQNIVVPALQDFVG